mgnify:CR=1 FL=1
MTRMTKERWAVIEKEMAIPLGWFCSDWIKDIAKDLYDEILVYRAERDEYKRKCEQLCNTCGPLLVEVPAPPLKLK